MKNALYVLLGVMAGFVLAGVLVFVSRAPAGNAITLQPAPTDAPIAVHVIGAVPRPGLYEFPEGTRIQDAIDAAGGLLAEAVGEVDPAEEAEHRGHRQQPDDTRHRGDTLGARAVHHSAHQRERGRPEEQF